MYWFAHATRGHGGAVLPCNKQVTNLDEVLIQLEDEKNRHGELGDLTQSFIVMANAVKQKMVEIREMNASLEDKITQSTAQLRAAYIEMARLARCGQFKKYA